MGVRTHDEMEKCFHYKYWEEDIALPARLPFPFLRYGPQLHRTFLGPDRFDWSFADKAFAKIYELDLVPIVDLCHFGVPDWIGNFQNPDFPAHFAPYARIRHPLSLGAALHADQRDVHLRDLLSRYGWWNEQLADDLRMLRR